MRLFTLVLLSLLIAMSAAAVPIPISPTLPITLPDNLYGGTNPGGDHDNGDVLGLLKDFDIDYVRFTVITAGEVQALIHVNYHHGETSPLALDAWDFGSDCDGKHLNSGDLLFDVNGTYKYAVPIVGHDSLTAGALYSITNVETAKDVLGDIDGINKNIKVWMNPSGAELIGNKIALGYARDDPSDSHNAAGIITLRFKPTADFLGFLGNPGLSVHYASATCANDYLDGNFRYAVPEPMSMVLMGGGLVALGLFGRRRLLRRR